MAKHYGGGSGNFHIGTAPFILVPMISFKVLKFAGAFTYHFINNIAKGEYLDEQGNTVKIDSGARPTGGSK